MQVIQDAFHAVDLPRGAIATIGNFDGIHRGQRAILETVVARAEAADVPSALVTFDPHPLSVLRPEQAPPLLATPEAKARRVEELGVDALLVVRFDQELAETPAEAFVRGFLAGRLAVREVHVGEGFSFGHRRGGDFELLRRLGEELGFEAHAVPAVELGGERISSTRIRRAVAEGRMEDAAEMLGRPYSLSGTVARGDRMGKRLGWPTINLRPETELVPQEGVYAGRVHLAGFPSVFTCVTNIGTRPTVYENYQRVVESHILDFSADVYGEWVEVELHKRLREERLFPTVMDLSAQIRRDVESTREYFAARRRLEEQVTPGG
jgi:riboflavin kinase / FMN adenylyltransferase